MNSDKPQKKLSVAMVAGEASGDLLAGLLLDGLRLQWPQLQAYGIGGRQMEQRGFASWWPAERLSVHGYSLELVRRIYGLIKMRRSLREKLLASPPDIFVGVDAPDFNLGLESDLRAAGIKTVHFVCPSVWAWRPKRLTAIRQSADLVLCVFPFEPALLAQHQISATYVGHPLANLLPMQPDRNAARTRLGLDLDADILAILPGSRSAEIQYITPRFLEAAALLLQSKPNLQLLIPAVSMFKKQIELAVVQAGLESAVRVIEGQSHQVLMACDATLIASGTATLEAALLKRPMVIGYRMHPISWWLMKRKQLQPWVGLPNILCQEFVVPELIQDAGTPTALAEACLYWLDAKHHQPEVLRQLEKRFTDLHQLLQRDTAQLAAHAIAQLC